MFSIKIDKLVEMTDTEQASISDTVNNVLTKISFENETIRSIGMVGNARLALKFANILAKKGRKVLFIDGDFSKEVFLGKFKLGKSLKGVTDYVSLPMDPKELLCLTSQQNLHLMFTGDVDTFAGVDTYKDKLSELLDTMKGSYDILIVQSDNEGKMAALCDRTLAFIEAKTYTKTLAELRVQALDRRGCYCLGVASYE
jgi:hypothetical protein